MRAFSPADSPPARRLCGVLAVVAAAALAAAGARAANPDDVPNYDRTPRGQEQAVPGRDLPRFPPFPRSENLYALDAEAIGSRYEYWIDLESVTVDDLGIVRYTVVMRTPKGATNILFEGFRCDAQTYKTYAYGTRSGTFHAYDAPDWRRLADASESRSRAYLWLLANRYFCGFDGTRLFLKDIRKTLRGRAIATDEGWKKAWDK